MIHRKKIHYRYYIVVFTIVSIAFIYSKTQSKSKSVNRMTDNVTTKKSVPAWTKNAVIYEVNLRQYSVAGTFSEFEKNLPRLKEMGITILWLMPVNPIGIKNRKGTLGSYYSVKDYTAINPEFGTMADFKHLVNKIHEMGMYVIIDWVANHTAWDNEWVTKHPDWYVQDAAGNILAPVPDWTDVADLNYTNKEMRKGMIEALKFWLRETSIDGFRCDVAGMVPTDFWNEARPELDKVKTNFMLAEWEDPALNEIAFDMSYTWDFHHAIEDIAKNKKDASCLDSLFYKEFQKWQKDAYRMYFTSNHDENTWNGTAYEKFGDGLKAFTVLTFTIPGMPLIYSGQEAGLNKRLKFFDKDVIEWKKDEMSDFYKALIKIKKDNQALWNGAYGGDMRILKNSAHKNVFAFTRTKNDNKLLIVLNLSGNQGTVKIEDSTTNGKWKEVLTNAEVEFHDNTELPIKPWDYKIFVKRGSIN